MGSPAARAHRRTNAFSELPVRDGRTERRVRGRGHARVAPASTRKAGGTACSSTPRRSTARQPWPTPSRGRRRRRFRRAARLEARSRRSRRPRGPFAFANTKLSSLKSPCTMRPLGSLGGTCARNHSISSVMNGSGVTSPTLSAVLPRPPLHLPPRERPSGLPGNPPSPPPSGPRGAARPGCRPWRRTRRRGARRRAGTPARLQEDVPVRERHQVKRSARPPTRPRRAGPCAARARAASSSAPRAFCTAYSRSTACAELRILPGGFLRSTYVARGLAEEETPRTHRPCTSDWTARARTASPAARWLGAGTRGTPARRSVCGGGCRDDERAGRERVRHGRW